MSDMQNNNPSNAPRGASPATNDAHDELSTLRNDLLRVIIDNQKCISVLYNWFRMFEFSGANTDELIAFRNIAVNVGITLCDFSSEVRRYIPVNSDDQNLRLEFRYTATVGVLNLVDSPSKSAGPEALRSYAVSAQRVLMMCLLGYKTHYDTVVGTISEITDPEAMDALRVRYTNDHATLQALIDRYVSPNHSDDPADYRGTHMVCPSGRWYEG